VARIDAPRLRDIEITFLHVDYLTIGLSNLREFIDRIEMHKSHRQAHILFSERTISISLIQPGAPMRLRLRLSCKSLSLQLSSMVHICSHFSACLFNVEDLRIGTTRQPQWELQDVYTTRRWLEVIKAFTGVKWFHIAGELSLSTNLVRALLLQDRHKTVLPALHKLCIQQLGSHLVPLREAAVSFMTSRWLSGHPIAVEYELLYPLRRLRKTGTWLPSATTILANSFETGPSPLPVTSEMLSDDILLNIFRHYLAATPHNWPVLVWVCRRWRQIVFASPLGLNLRLYCTYGTPVLKSLDSGQPSLSS
jgi:hypothetical protein